MQKRNVNFIGDRVVNGTVNACKDIWSIDVSNAGNICQSTTHKINYNSPTNFFAIHNLMDIWFRNDFK